MKWSTACPDWEQRIVAGQSLIASDPLFPDEGEAALEVFKALRVADLPGIPTFGDVCDEWVFDLVRAIFGAYDAEARKRLISKFWLLISKKNSKSTLAAGIAMTALIRNWRHSAELLVLAPSKEVADNVFIPARDMIRHDEELTELLHYQDHKRSITHRITGAVLKVVAADSEAVSGKKASVIIIEEVWLFGKKANARAMLDEATGGLVSRDEGFELWLSTHSDDAAAGVFKDELDYCRDVRDGKIDDPHCLPVLYEWPQDMLESEAYLDPQNFYVTNPNIGRSVSQDWLEKKLKEKQSGDDEDGDIQMFLAKHLNVPIGQRLARNRWAGTNYWAGAADTSITLESLIERCEVVTAGIDGGGLDDLFGLAACGRCKVTRDWLFWFRAWCQTDVLKKRKKIATKLREFEQEGSLIICPDDDVRQDFREAANIIRKLNQAGVLPEKCAVGCDPVGISEFVDYLYAPDDDANEDLVGIALGDEQVMAVPQGYKLNSAIKGFERKLKDGSAWHDGSAMMTWVASNAKATMSGSATVVTKRESGVGKIDPLIAGFNAFQFMAMNPTASTAGAQEDYFASLKAAAQNEATT